MIYKKRSFLKSNLKKMLTSIITAENITTFLAQSRETVLLNDGSYISDVLGGCAGPVRVLRLPPAHRILRTQVQDPHGQIIC
jgi:hypothetical protein